MPVVPVATSSPRADKSQRTVCGPHRASMSAPHQHPHSRQPSQPRCPPWPSLCPQHVTSPPPAERIALGFLPRPGPVSLRTLLLNASSSARAPRTLLPPWAPGPCPQPDTSCLSRLSSHCLPALLSQSATGVRVPTPGPALWGSCEDNVIVLSRPPHSNSNATRAGAFGSATFQALSRHCPTRWPLPCGCRALGMGPVWLRTWILNSF